MIPLLHDFSGSAVLIFGGGSVGARKARRFAREARVVVVSPVFGSKADFGGAERVRAAPEPDDLTAWFNRADPALVVAATDRTALNTAIERTARERGILVNRADTHGERSWNNVVVPATIEDDPVSVAVATGGTSPALSRYLRERIEEEFTDAGAMANLTGDLREELRKRGIEPEDRRAAIRAVVRSPSVWKALGARGTNPEQVARSVIDETLTANEGEAE